MADTRPEHHDGIHRIRHHLAHATMGLQSHEAAARRAMGDSSYDDVRACLERARARLDHWISQEFPSL